MPSEARIVLVAAAILFVCFRIYRRVRGSIGRQPLQQGWLIARASLLLLVCGAALALSPANIGQAALYAAGGAMLGGLVAAYALSHTSVEHTEKGCFYTGHPYIGLGIVGLFVARLLFVFTTAFARRHEIAAQVQAHGGTIGSALAQSESGPLTLGVLALMAGYYAVYSLGLLRKVRQPRACRA